MVVEILSLRFDLVAWFDGVRLLLHLLKSALWIYKHSKAPLRLGEQLGQVRLCVVLIVKNIFAFKVEFRLLLTLDKVRFALHLTRSNEKLFYKDEKLIEKKYFRTA